MQAAGLTVSAAHVVLFVCQGVRHGLALGARGAAHIAPGGFAHVCRQMEKEAMTIFWVRHVDQWPAISADRAATAVLYTARAKPQH